MFEVSMHIADKRRKNGSRYIWKTFYETREYYLEGLKWLRRYKDRVLVDIGKSVFYSEFVPGKTIMVCRDDKIYHLSIDDLINNIENFINCGGQ